MRKKRGILDEEIGNKRIQIEISAEGEVVAVKDHQSQPISSVYSYWFAWQAFHPETAVYGEKK